MSKDETSNRGRPMCPSCRAAYERAYGEVPREARLGKLREAVLRAGRLGRLEHTVHYLVEHGHAELLDALTADVRMYDDAQTYSAYLEILAGMTELMASKGIVPGSLEPN